jgi:hypothetical protein
MGGRRQDIVLKRIEDWKTQGYLIEIVYLRLASPQLALRRIASRVRQPGITYVISLASSTVAIFLQEAHRREVCVTTRLQAMCREEVEPVSFMITLWAGSLPPVLARLPDAQLQHLAVFSSRSREEGRERFRLHLGYFDDLSTAERTLRRVRQWYPSAWAVPAERHAALARLPALAAPCPLTPRETLTLLEEPAAPEPAAPAVPAVPPEREAVAWGALAIDPVRPPDTAPVPLSMHDSVDFPVAAPWPLTPRETLALLEAPAAPEPAVHLLRGDGGHPRASLEVSEWRPAAPKSSSKPKATSWLRRLTA